MTDVLTKVFSGDASKTSLEDAKNWLRLRARKGAHCPCCKQHVKIYRRPLGSQMARWLIWLVRVYEALPDLPKGHNGIRGWIDIRESPVRGGDYAKLVHWDLAENRANVDPELRTSGLWRPTPKGIDFVQRRIVVPSHVELYDNHPLGFSEEMIGIDAALGKWFNYEELMNAPVKVQVPV